MARNNYKSEKRRKELKKQKKRQEKELRREQRKLETYDEDGNLIQTATEEGDEETTEERGSAPTAE